MSVGRLRGFWLPALIAILASTKAVPASAHHGGDGGGGRWTKPQEVLGPRHAVGAVAAAEGPHNYAVLAWASGHAQDQPDGSSSRGTRRHVFASVRTADENRFGEPKKISRRAALASPFVAIGPGGLTLVGWTDRKHRVTVALRGQRGWPEPGILSNRGAGLTSLAFGPDGSAYVAWRSGPIGDERIMVSVRPPQRSFSEPLEVARGASIGDHGPLVEAGGGAAAVGWTGPCPLDRPEAREPVRVATVFPNGTFSEPEAVPNTECPDAGIDLAVADDGTTLVIVNGSLDPSGGIRASIRMPGSAFPPAEYINKEGQTTDFAKLGVDASGRAVVVWTLYKGVRPQALQVSIREPAGEFSTPRRIGARRPGGRELAVGRDGSALVVWQSLDSRRLKASHMSPSGWFGGPETVSRPLSRRSLAQPSVSIGPKGRALVAWARPSVRHAGGWGIYASRRKNGPLCMGHRPTVVGTPDDDVLRGTSRSDVILGDDGNDTIKAGGGDDLVCGGRGDDVVIGGDGSDSLRGGRGDDHLDGGRGHDTMRGGLGTDTCRGGPGSNKLRGCER